MIMPPQVGGFWLREAALFADDGACIAVGNMPETYKPLLSEGSGRFQIIRMQLKVSSTADVELITDPSVILATVEDVNALEGRVKDYADEQLSEHEQTRNHPDATLKERGFTQLSNAIDSDSETLAATPAAIKAAIAEAVRSAWEGEHPIGDIVFRAVSENPNVKWPWSTWQYLGDGLSLRTAKEDGSDLLQTGGSDEATLAVDNLPKHKFSVTGSTNEDPGAEFDTGASGEHYHDAGVAGKNARHGSVGTTPDYGYKGSDNSNEASIPLTSTAPNHAHRVVVPKHAHTVDGETNEIGSNTPFSIVEKHIKVMAWRRIA
ncbi:Phage tail fibre repeat [Serratia ficaria]|nr:Phage tail fibre repeat [Serratia ficaria]CAI2429924.1 Phage tail fibre repeat [Serratia ficaria]